MNRAILAAVSPLALAACVTPYGPPPTQVSAPPNVAVNEGGIAFVPITKTGQGQAKFTYQTVPGSAADSDFIGQSGTIITAGNAIIAIGTVDDADHEPSEDFRLVIGPKGNTTVIDPEAAILIIDNDAAPPQPITCWDMSVVVPPGTCPPEPAKPPSGDIIAGIDGLPPINAVDPMLATKAAGNPASAAPDVVGAFRFICGFAGVGRFDPKVYPGDMTGKSHGHQFYGNTGIYPYSGYPELRDSGFSSCSYGEFPANRTGYWQPWLEDGKGHVLQADYITVYYKRRPKTDPACLANGQKGCVDAPHGLFFIFGYDFLTQTAPTGEFDFTCQVGSTTYAFKTLGEAAASGRCIGGTKFTVRGTAPECWDGAHVDSANHRSHVANKVRNNNTGQTYCGAAHPYVIPKISIFSTWSIAEGDDLSQWFFSSDHMRPDLPKGSTFHVDIFQAWEPGVHTQFHTGCIDQLLNCSSGYTQPGRMINAASQPFYPDPVTGKPVSSWTNPYRLIPIPGVEANGKLVGMSFGRAGPRDWPRGARPPKKIPVPPVPVPDRPE